MDAGHVAVVNREVVLKYLRDLKGVLDHGSVGERRAFLRSFVRSVERGASHVTIHYTLPLPPERVPSDPLGVLDSVNDGGPSRTEARTQPTFELPLQLAF